jgi:hypothetical protein
MISFWFVPFIYEFWYQYSETGTDSALELFHEFADVRNHISVHINGHASSVCFHTRRYIDRCNKEDSYINFNKNWSDADLVEFEAMKRLQRVHKELLKNAKHIVVARKNNTLEELMYHPTFMQRMFDDEKNVFEILGY